MPSVRDARSLFHLMPHVRTEYPWCTISLSTVPYPARYPNLDKERIMARLFSHSPVNVAKARRRWTRSYLIRRRRAFVRLLCRRSLASERCVRVARADGPSMMFRKVSSTKGREDAVTGSIMSECVQARSIAACRVSGMVEAVWVWYLTWDKVGVILPAPVSRDALCGGGKSAFFDSSIYCKYCSIPHLLSFTNITWV